MFDDLDFQIALARRQWLPAACLLGSGEAPPTPGPWRAVLADWLTLARAAWERAAPPKWRIAAVGRLFFAQLRIRPVSAKADPAAMTLRNVVERRAGNCLALTTLYLLMADRLDIPLAPVFVRGHVFVRYDDGACRRNIETTHRGADLPDRLYLAGRDDAGPASLHPLSAPQFLAVLLASRAAHVHAPRLDWPRARSDLDLALTLFPGLGFAYLNRAVVHAGLGHPQASAADLKAAWACASQSDAVPVTADEWAALVHRNPLLRQYLQEAQQHVDPLMVIT